MGQFIAISGIFLTYGIAGNPDVATFELFCLPWVAGRSADDGDRGVTVYGVYFKFRKTANGSSTGLDIFPPLEMSKLACDEFRACSCRINRGASRGAVLLL